MSKRFFSCPPPLLSPPLSSKPSPERHGVSPETGAGRGGVRGSGSDGMVIDSTSVKPKHASAAAAVAAATRAAVSVSGAAAACGSVFASSAASTVPAASSAGRGKRLGSFDDDSDNNDDGGGCRNGEKENRLLTLEDAGLQAGASICFFRVGCGGRGRASVLRTYTGIAEELVEGVRELLQRRGPLGRVHLLKVRSAAVAAVAAPLRRCDFCCRCAQFSFLMFLFVFHCRQYYFFTSVFLHTGQTGAPAIELAVLSARYSSSAHVFCSTWYYSCRQKKLSAYYTIFKVQPYPSKRELGFAIPMPHHPPCHCLQLSRLLFYPMSVVFQSSAIPPPEQTGSS